MLKKRRLGRTNLMVTELGFGAMDTPQVEEGYTTLELALDLGVNFVDTAREYEGSEYLIGRMLRERGKKDFYVATKTFSRTGDGSQYDVDRSLRVLGTDLIDLYQLHDISSEEAWNQVMSDGGALEGLQIAKFRGLISHIGISSHDLKILEKAIISQEFDTVMLEYSAFYQEMEELIPLAREADIGVIVMRPLGGSGRTSSIRARISRGEVSLTPAMLLQYVLSHPDISVAIPGVRYPDRVKENIKLAESYNSFDEFQRQRCCEEAFKLI